MRYSIPYYHVSTPFWAPKVLRPNTILKVYTYVQLRTLNQFWKYKMIRWGLNHSPVCQPNYLTLLNFPFELDTMCLIKIECLESIDGGIKKLKKKRKLFNEIGSSFDEGKTFSPA